MENSAIFDTKKGGLTDKPIYLITQNINSQHIEPLLKLLSAQNIELRIQNQTNCLSQKYDKPIGRIFVIVDNLNGTVLLGQIFSSLRMFIVGYPRQGKNKKNYYCSKPQQILQKYQQCCSLPAYQHKLYSSSSLYSKCRINSLKTSKSKFQNEQVSQRKQSLTISSEFTNNYQLKTEKHINTNRCVRFTDKVDQNSILFLYSKSRDSNFIEYLLKLRTIEKIKHQLVESYSEFQQILLQSDGQNHFVLIDVEFVGEFLCNKPERFSIIIYKSSDSQEKHLKDYLIGYKSFIKRICKNEKEINECMSKLGFQIESENDNHKLNTNYYHTYGNQQKVSNSYKKFKSKNCLSWRSSSKDILSNQKKEIINLKQLQSECHIKIQQNVLRFNGQKIVQKGNKISQNDKLQSEISIDFQTDKKSEADSKNQSNTTLIHKIKSSFLASEHNNRNQQVISANKLEEKHLNENEDKKSSISDNIRGVIKKVSKIHLKQGQKKIRSFSLSQKSDFQSISSHRTGKVRRITVKKSEASNEYNLNRPFETKKLEQSNMHLNVLRKDVQSNDDQTTTTKKLVILNSAPTVRKFRILSEDPVFFHVYGEDKVVEQIYDANTKSQSHKRKKIDKKNDDFKTYLQVNQSIGQKDYFVLNDKQNIVISGKNKVEEDNYEISNQKNESNYFSTANSSMQNTFKNSKGSLGSRQLPIERNYLSCQYPRFGLSQTQKQKILNQLTKKISPIEISKNLQPQSHQEAQWRNQNPNFTFRQLQNFSNIKQQKLTANNQIRISYLIMKGQNFQIEYCSNCLIQQFASKNFKNHKFIEPNQLFQICEQIMKENFKQSNTLQMSHNKITSDKIKQYNSRKIVDINFILDEDKLNLNLQIIRKRVMKKIKKCSKIRIFILPKTSMKSEFRKKVVKCMDEPKLKKMLHTYENKIILKNLYITDYSDYVQEIIDIFG